MAILSEVLGPQQVPMHRQLQEMKRLHPAFTATWECGEVVWHGLVRPTALANEYSVRIAYRMGDAPRVYVDQPKLQSRGDGTSIPHLYKEGHLCLFLPFGFEWDVSKLIAATILPWATLWLHHYEVWRVTGDWLGGGQHPRGRGGETQ